MPNRSAAPPISKLPSVPFPDFRESKLGGKIPFIYLHSSNYEVVKIEFVFNAGRFYEKGRMISRATHMMLKSGTSTMTSAAINEQIDFYGASVGLKMNFDTGTVGLYCLSKNVQALIPLVIDLITDTTFPEKELQFYRDQEKSKLNVALGKVDNMAFRTITAQMFGADHPYGYNTVTKDIENLTTTGLKEHHQRLYTADNCKIYICGNLTDGDLQVLENEVSRLPSGEPAAYTPRAVSVEQPRATTIQMDDKVQVAIRIGRKTFNRQHKDFQKVYLFGVFLGGYFGSRLSMKIREEKGYTYGIHTTMDAMLRDGFFIISTEVANEYADLTREAIYAELDDLRTNVPSIEELQQMKNYLQGYFLGSVDGVFRSSRVLKGLRETGVDEKYFERLQVELDHFSPEDIVEIANKYFKKEDLYEVVVGSV